MAEIVFRGTKEQAYQLLARTRRVLSGNEADPTGILEQALLEVGRLTLDIVHEAFLDKAYHQQDEAGLVWTRLKQSTIARKKGDDRILIETGLLADSFEPGHPQNKLETYPDNATVAVGTLVDYYPDLHHEGRPPRLPRRPLWADTDTWPPQWREELADLVRDAFVRLFLALAKLEGFVD